MYRLFLALGILGLTVSLAVAGPNAGGTLIIHDTGLTFSTVADLPVPPPTTPPASCEATDNSAPAGTYPLQLVWKVYASFPCASSPRLKGLAWGISGTAGIYVTTAGLPDPPNCFQVVSGAWPSPPGSIGQSFVYTQTTHLVECYWFGGYAYESVFATVPHATQASNFIDDATPGNLDAIAGFSTLGFGGPGQTVCGDCPDVPGACCYPDGTCEFLLSQDCTGTFVGGDCFPGLCPVVESTGACCLPDLNCVIVTAAECAAQYGIYWGDDVPCLPGMCETPTEERSWGRIKASFR